MQRTTAELPPVAASSASTAAAPASQAPRVTRKRLSWSAGTQVESLFSFFLFLFFLLSFFVVVDVHAARAAAKSRDQSREEKLEEKINK
jgi:hypothetical protein